MVALHRDNPVGRDCDFDPKLLQQIPEGQHIGLYQFTEQVTITRQRFLYHTSHLFGIGTGYCLILQRDAGLQTLHFRFGLLELGHEGIALAVLRDGVHDVRELALETAKVLPALQRCRRVEPDRIIKLSHDQFHDGVDGLSLHGRFDVQTLHQDTEQFRLCRRPPV